MNVELHLLVNGVDKGPLPSYQSLQLSPIFCEVGGLSFRYPKNGKRYGLIKGKDELEIVPWIDGVARPVLGGYVNQIAGDDTADVSVQEYSGQTYLRRMDEVRVYPFNWPSFDPKSPSWFFTTQNGGQIVKALLTAAQARGTATDITHASFTNTTDSNGVAWAKTISVEVKPGATLLNVLRSLYENNMVEFEMVGHDLRVYNIDTLSVDRTAGPGKPLTFRKGRDLTDSPRKVSSRDIATVMLSAGKEDAGIYHEEVNATAVASRRRIEGYVSNGNIVEPGSLEAFTEARLGQSVNPTMEKTHGLALANKKTPKPLTDFNVGDWAYSDTGDGLEKLRVKQWVVSVDDKGIATGSVTLNDLIAEMNERLTKRIDGIIGGSTITGESKAVDAVPVDLIDGIAPSTPTGLGLSSVAFFDAGGAVQDVVTATWAAVTTNTDGSVIDDLDGYTVRWRYQGETGWRIASSPGTGTTVSWSPVVALATVQAQVQAYDKAGNLSGWSTLVSHTTQGDLTPPEAPSAPIMTNYLGLIRAYWDGNTASGAAWAKDMKYVQVHASTVNNFTPTTATWVDSLNGSGYSYIKATYGTSMYVKFVAVDYSGNLSAASAQSSATSTQVVSSDIFDGAVGTAKIADLAITNAKIGLLAVNDAQIGSLNVAKLVSGTGTFDLVVAGRIATALTGQRAGIDSLGFFGYDGSEQLTIRLDGLNNLLTGVLKTALSGRRIEIGAGGASGQISFYAPDGTLSQLQSGTDEFGNEALKMVVPVSGVNEHWNTLHIDNNQRLFGMSSAISLVFGGGISNGQFGVYSTTSRGTPGAFPTSVLRLMVGPDSNGSFFLTAGAFNIYEHTTGGANLLRMQAVGGGATNFYQAPGGVVASRFSIGDSTTSFYPSGNVTTGGQMIVNPGYLGGAYNSPRITFWTPTLPDNLAYAGSIIYNINPDATQYGIAAVTAGNDAYIPMKASAFQVLSDMRAKSNVTPADPALPALLATPVRKYTQEASLGPRRFHMEKVHGQDGNVTEVAVDDGPDPSWKPGPPVTKTGLVAQEAEALGVVIGMALGESGDLLGIDLYQYVAKIHKGLQELAAEVRGGRPA